MNSLFIRRRFAVYVCLALVLMSIALPSFAADDVTLPAPTGDYSVGRTVYDWTDTNRDEPYTEDAADHRQLQVWAWYPADTADAQPAPYLNEGMAALLAQMFAIPAEQVHSHAVADVPLADEQVTYPVIVFSHGNGSNVAFYASLLEELASHGYIVFGVDHTWNALLTAANGAVVPGLPQAQDQSPDDFEVRLADIGFVLDQLEALNESDALFAGKLDLEHIGLAGHSFGGATAAEACRADARCDAALVMDVPLQGVVATEGLTQPIMFMAAERLTCDELFGEMEAILGSPAPEGSDEACAAMNVMRDAGDAVAISASSAGYNISIDGARHGNFGDMPYLFRLQPLLQAQLGGFPTIADDRGWRVSSDYALAFFNQYLKGEASPLLDGPSPDYPEVIFAS